MRLHRNTVWIVPLAFMVTFPIWSIPIGKYLTPRGGFEAPQATNSSTTRNFILDSVQITQNQNGKRTAFIRAKSAWTGDDPNLLYMETIDADLYDEEGKMTKVIANNGNYHTITKLLVLIDEVIVNKTVDKQILYTDLLNYDSEKRTVNCPGATRLVAEDAVIKGGSLDYDIVTQKYEIGGRVHCDLQGFLEP